VQAQGKRLLKNIRFIDQTKLQGKLHDLFIEIPHFIRSISSQPLLTTLMNDTKNLLKKIALDKEGKLAITPETWEQLRIILTHSVIEKMQVPLPEMKFENVLGADITIFDAALSLKDLTPSDLVIEDRARIALDLKDLVHPDMKTAINGVRLIFRNIKTDVQAAKFHIHNHGLDLLPSFFNWPMNFLFGPHATDDIGRLSVHVGGKGMDLTVILRTHTSPERLFDVERVECRIHNISFCVGGTRHNTLYNTLLTTFAARWRAMIESAVEDKVRHAFLATKTFLSSDIARNVMPDLKGVPMGQLIQDLLVSHPLKVPDVVQDVMALVEEHGLATLSSEK